MDIKQQHSNALKKLRNLFPKTALLEYENGAIVNVPCTMGKEKNIVMNFDSYMNRHSFIVNVLIDDLKEQKASLKNITYVTIDRVKYQVEAIHRNGIIDDTIKLYCKLLG